MTKATASASAVEAWITPPRLVHSEPESCVMRVGPLRDVAIELDRFKAVFHDADADFVLRGWEGLLSGRSELIDWFDAEGRRFIIPRFDRPTPYSAGKRTGREPEVAL